MKRGSVFVAWMALACSAGVREPQRQPRSDPMTRAEIEIGKMAGALGSGDPADEYDDPRLGQYVSAVGLRVAAQSERRDLPWKFSVLDSPDVDARAYPGGRISITRGALAVLGSEAELAGVLAHEVAHVSFHHSDAAWRPDFPAEGGELAVTRSAQRDADHERQADALAVRYLSRAKYDARGLGVALTALERGSPSPRSPGDPHPAADARASRLAVLVGDASGEWARERYLAHVDGLTLGVGRRTPRLEGQRYVAPGALSFVLPAGFRAELKSSLLEAKAGDGRELVIFGLSRPGSWTRAFLGGFRSMPHTVTEVAGGPAYSIRSSTPGASATLLERGGTLLVLIAPDDTLDDVLRSAKPAPLPTRGPRLVLRRTKHATELASFLDAECPATRDAEAERLNGISHAARLRPGWLVKCVSPNSIAVGPSRK